MKQGKKTTRDTRKIASCIWNINHYNYIIKPQKNAKNLRARNPLVTDVYEIMINGSRMDGVGGD